MNSLLGGAAFTRRGSLALGTRVVAAAALASCTAPPRFITATSASVRQADLAGAVNQIP